MCLMHAWTVWCCSCVPPYLLAPPVSGASPGRPDPDEVWDSHSKHSLELSLKLNRNYSQDGLNYCCYLRVENKVDDWIPADRWLGKEEAGSWCQGRRRGGGQHGDQAGDLGQREDPKICKKKIFYRIRKPADQISKDDCKKGLCNLKSKHNVQL